MEKKNADQETVTGASRICNGSNSAIYVRDYKGISTARNDKFYSSMLDRPNFSNPKGSDRKSRHQEVGEWSLEECRHSIMELAKELNRVVKTPKQSQSAGQVEQRKGAELRNKEDLPGLEGEELNQEEEQRLKDGHDIIMEWARELKTVPENSVSVGEAVEQGVAELVKEWKRGKLRNILPIMEFIMWALIKEEADKGMLKSLNIGAGRCIPDSAWQWIHTASVDVTLDPDTAQPELTLSAEGKRVRVGETRQSLSDTPERFDYWCCVLGREGFTSGRRYWQVQVGGNAWWILGVSRESAERKGVFSMTPQQGYWTVEWWSKRGFSALTDPDTPLPRSLKPQKLGVYLDYEEGQLSFYNVETRSHIYTFTDMEFNPNEKLCPFFCNEDKNTALVLESP